MSNHPYNPTVEHILSRLEAVKARGDGWMARCPAHDDKNPSLSIGKGVDGRVLLKCHAGCDTADVVKALGMEFRDLMSTNVNVNKKATCQPVRSNNVDGNVQMYPTAAEAISALERRYGAYDAVWNYADETGCVVGHVLRWDTQEAKRIRPVSLTDEGWVCGGMPAPRPLYRLPELAQQACVYVTEGEKAAEAARSVGLTATTSAHGSKSAAKTDWSPLAGKEVVILPDADDAGDRYAEDVVSLLSRLVPRPTMKVVRLPDIPPGGDIADFIELRLHDTSSDAVVKEIEQLVSETEVVSVKKPVDAALPYKKFRIELLPEPLKSFVEIGSKAMCCDHALIALPLLVACAAAIGNRFRVRLKPGWAEPSILWGGVVSLSGSVKSPAIKLAIEPFHNMERDADQAYRQQLERYQRAVQEYERDCANWKRKGGSELPTKPSEPQRKRYLVSDITIEALAPVLADSPLGVLLFCDELAGWLGSFGRYSGGRGIADVSQWLSIFNATPIIVDRKTGNQPTIQIESPAVSICGSIQPNRLRALIGQEHRDNGLLPRFLLTKPPCRPKRWSEHCIPPAKKASIEDLMRELRVWQPETFVEGFEPFEVPLSAAAMTHWARFYNSHNEELNTLSDDLRAVWAKLEAYAARLALVIYMIRCVTGASDTQSGLAIDEASMKVGIELARWFGHEARRVYALMDESETDVEKRQLLELIERHGGSISSSELVRASRAFDKVMDAEEALDRLMREGIGTWHQPPQRGRGRPAAKRFVLAG